MSKNIYQKEDFSLLRQSKLREIFHSVLNYVINEAKEEKEIKSSLNLVVNFVKTSLNKTKETLFLQVAEESEKDLAFREMLENEFLESVNDLQRMISFMFVDYTDGISVEKEKLLKALFFDELFILFFELSKDTYGDEKGAGKNEKYIEQERKTCYYMN